LNVEDMFGSLFPAPSKDVDSHHQRHGAAVCTCIGRTRHSLPWVTRPAAVPVPPELEVHRQPVPLPAATKGL